MATLEQENKKSGNIMAIATMFALFFMIAFVTNFAGSMGVIVKNQFGASNTASQFGSAANFLAYFFMGIPGGLILKRKGYKFTALLAAAVGFVGVGVQLLSGYAASFVVYVIGAFIAGLSMCLLNLVVNPMLNTLGGEGKKGNQLVQFGSSINSIGATLAPYILGCLIGNEVAKAQVSDAAPALLIAMGIFALAFIIVLVSKIPEPHMETAQEKADRLSGKTSVIRDIVATLKFRHFTFGALAIFFYIIIESGIPNMANLYMTETKEISRTEMTVEQVDAENKKSELADAAAEKAAELKGEKYVKPVAKPGDEIVTFVKETKNGKELGYKVVSIAQAGYIGAVVAGSVVAIYWLLMMCGRLIGGAIGGKVSSKVMVTFCAVGGIALMLAAMFCPVKMVEVFGKTIPLSMCFAVACGACTSVMWGAIFNLAAEGLGKYVPMGSGIFMMCVFGGVCLPLQGLIADTIGILNSYWLTIGLFAYVLVYAHVLSKPKAAK